MAFGHTDRFDGVLTTASSQQPADPAVLQQLDINSLQRVSDSFCNDSFSTTNQRTHEPSRTIEMTLPQKNLCDLRNKIVEKMIMSIGQKLK